MLKAIGLVLVWLAMVGKLIWLGGLGREKDKGGWFWSFNVFFISTLLDEFIGGCFFKKNLGRKMFFSFLYYHHHLVLWILSQFFMNPDL